MNKFIFDISNPKFNKMYILATFFDPSTKSYIQIPDDVVYPIKMSKLNELLSKELSKLGGGAPAIASQGAYQDLDKFLPGQKENTSEFQK